MYPAHPTRRLAAVAGAIAVTLIACGGDDDGQAGSGLASGDDYSVVGALAELHPIQVRDDLMIVSTADLATVSEHNGVERPESLDRDELVPWLNAVSPFEPDADRPVYAPLPPQVTEVNDMGIYAAVTGVSILDIDAFVSASAPPLRFDVLVGDELADVEFPDDLIDLGDGIVSVGDADDFAPDLTGDTAIDRMGRSLRLVKDDDRVVTSLSTPAAAAWAAGPADSADDHLGARLTPVGAALDEAGVVAAVLVDYADDGTDRETGDLPGPFVAVGLGWSVDDDGEAMTTIVYDFVDDDVAASAVAVLEERFVEGDSAREDVAIADLLELVSIDAEGPLVVVTARPGEGRPPGVAHQMLQRVDPPFTYV